MIIPNDNFVTLNLKLLLSHVICLTWIVRISYLELRHMLLAIGIYLLRLLESSKKFYFVRYFTL